MPSNLSLQSVLDYVATNVRGANLADVLGVQNEPGLSICNDVYQETLQKPLTWRFNKANAAGTGLGILYWTTLQYQQDYPLTNANVSPILYVANTSNPYPGPVPSGGVVHIPTVYNFGLVVASGVGTLKTNWAHNYAVGQTVYLQNVGQWSGGVFTADATGTINGVPLTIASIPTTTSLTFATSAPSGNYGAPGINDIGWIERLVIEDFANTATVKPRHSVEMTMNLELESIVQPPFKVSYQYTNTDPSTPPDSFSTTATSVVATTGSPVQVAVVSIAGMVIGQQAIIDSFGSGHQETVTITALSSAVPSFTATFTQTHLVGSFPVVGMGANIAVQTTPSSTAVFRVWPLPSTQPWGVMTDYQMAPQTFTDLAQTWGVWPDPLIFVIRQGVRAAALDFVEDPRAMTEYQVFQQKLDMVREIRDQERPSQTMFPDRSILFGG
jgi:hypothetical protein